MSLEEMSKSCQRAFGLNQMKHYNRAIEIFEEDLRENPKNIPSMNNIAFAKTHLGISENKKDYLLEAKQYLENAISIVKESEDCTYGYPIAEANLEWVNKLINE